MSALAFVTHMILEALLGIVKLFDDADRDKPWFATILCFLVTAGLVTLVFLSDWISVGVAWALGIVIVVLGVLAYRDFRWWREQRARIADK